MINKKNQASIKKLFEGRLTRYIYYLSVVNRPISNLKLEVQRGGTYLSSYPQTILPKPEWGTYLKMLRSSPTFFSSWLLLILRDYASNYFGWELYFENHKFGWKRWARYSILVVYLLLLLPQPPPSSATYQGLFERFL